MKSVRLLLAAFVVSFALTPALAHAKEVTVGKPHPENAGEPSDATAEPVKADAPAEAEGGGSMPQLDSTYYISQLFWLAVTAVLMYNIMKYIALPKVSGMVEKRDQHVRSDLEQAYKLKQEAEDLKIAYSRALRDSDEKAKTLMEKTVQQMRDKQTQGLHDAVARINVKISDSEKRLKSEKDALVGESEMISERLAKSVMTELAKGRAA